jgi:iron complex outermembrane recepter protein
VSENKHRSNHQLCKSSNEQGRATHAKRNYLPFVVGPIVGLTVLCAHAQSTDPTAKSTDSSPGRANDSAKSKSTLPSSPRPEAATQEVTTLNAVEVTANRRREPAREVPMQTNVLSAKELDRRGDSSLRDFLTQQPGVNLNAGSSGGAGGNSISMRGVTTGTDIGPTVGVYVDDIPFGSSTIYGLGAQSALDMGLLDLNHIELLRGPQGTLYGAGAMGGVLKYVTNEPDTEGPVSGSVGSMLSGTEHGGLNHTENAVVNVPIKQDVAALRVSAFNQTDGGYVNRVGNDPERGVDGATTRGARASLLVAPTNALTVRLTATTQEIKRDGTGFVDYNFATRQPIAGDLTQNRVTNEPYDQYVQLYSADIEYDFGWARLNAVSAWQSIHSNTALDYSPYASIVNSLSGAQIFDEAPLNQSSSNHKYTQEFRLTSPANRTFEWLAGLFYTDEHNTDKQLLQAVGPGVSTTLLDASIPSSYKEYAAYGDLTYHFTSRLSGTAGLRIAHNDQTFTSNTAGALAPTQSAPGTSSDTSKTFLFSLDYRLTQDSNVYARVASGYRPGGPQVSVTDPVTGGPTASTFQPDTLRSYEVGYKADLWDKRVSLSVSAFDIEWKNVQLDDLVDGLGLITNGGSARSRGIEFFGSLRPVPQWNLSAGMTFDNARLTESVPGIGALSGDRMPNTAAFAATVSADYSFNVATYRAYVGASETYIGPRNSSFEHSQTQLNFEMPGYVTTDLRAGIDFRKANVSFFVHNLFNRRGMQSASTDLVQLGGPAQVVFAQPLTVGMQVNVPF